jgi:hypothetical protein
VLLLLAADHFPLQAPTVDRREAEALTLQPDLGRADTLFSPPQPSHRRPDHRNHPRLNWRSAWTWARIAAPTTARPALGSC